MEVYKVYRKGIVHMSDPNKLAIDGGEPVRKTPVPMPYPGASVYGEEEKRSVTEVIDSKSPYRYYGPHVLGKARAFEKAFSEKIGNPYTLGVTSGTASLIVAMKAAGIGPGDKVIVPACTFIASAGAVVCAGAVPVFADIDESMNIDPDSIGKVVDKYTKAIMPVPILGNPCQMDRIMEAAKKYHLMVIEDVAQSCGSRYRDQYSGTFGEINCFSLQINKILTTGDGGAVTTKDAKLYERAVRYHDQGMFREKEGFLSKNAADDVFIGQNYRMSEITGAVALEQVKKMDYIVSSMHRIKYQIKEQIRDIVKYAAERYVTIIPEIDMPGHMQAALSAYPELGCTKGPYKVWQQWGISDDVLCAGNDTTVGFVEDVLSEIMELFPSEYIHIGGDECPKIRWEQCPACQQRIKNENIKATEQFTKEQGLQSWFMRRIEQYLNEHGRSIIGWDEILEGGLSPTATVMSWRSTSGGIEAAKMGNKVIMVPNQDLYFNYYQTLEIDNEPLAIGGYVPIENVYNLEPVPVDLPQEAKDNIIGLQANLWTEYIGDESLVEYMVLPRMAALSEVQWCNPENKSYHGFLKRIFRQFKIYSHLGYNYATQLLDVRMDLKSENGTVSVTMSTIDNADIYYTLDGTDPDINSEKYSAPIRIQRNCELRAVAIRGEKISKVSKEVFTVSETTGKPINVKTPPHRQYGFGGPNTLVDGLRGNINYRTGRWIGYYAQDFEADLTTNAEISYVSVNVCVNKGDGCFDIRGIRVYGRRVPSDEFSLIASADYPPMNRESPNSEIINHTVMFPPVDFNVLRVVLLHEHSMPEWQSNWGAGQPAFIFIDEIEAGYSMSFPGRQNPPQR